MGATRATALLHAGLRRDWVVLHPCYRCYTWQPKGKRHPIAPPPKIIPLVLGASGWFCLRSLPFKPHGGNHAPGRAVAGLGRCLTVVRHVVVKKTWAATAVGGN